LGFLELVVVMPSFMNIAFPMTLFSISVSPTFSIGVHYQFFYIFPASTPTKTLAMRGSWRAKINKDEPEPQPGIMEKPKNLKGMASDLWDFVTEHLDAINMLAKVDGTALARYCKLHEQFQKASDFIDEHGSTYPVKKTRIAKTKISKEVAYEEVIVDIKEFPQSKKLIQLSTELLKYETHFGLTPSARSRMIAGAKEKAKDKQHDRLKELLG